MNQLDSKQKHNLRNLVLRLDSITEIFLDNEQSEFSSSKIKTDALKTLEEIKRFFEKIE